MKEQIKQNLESHKQFLKYKKENYIEPWRGTGRTTRTLFDMSSRYPDGEFMMLCHSLAMAKYCFDKFVLMQVTFGAPITVNRSNLSVRLQDAKYSFKVDSMRLRHDLMSHVEIFEDHHVQETRRCGGW